MQKLEEDIKIKDSKPKRSYKRHSPKMIQKLKKLVYVQKMSKNKAADQCGIPRSTAKKKLADHQKAQQERRNRLKKKKQEEVRENDSLYQISFYQTETYHQDQSIFFPFSTQMFLVFPQYYYQ